MSYMGTYDRTIFYNPVNKYCIISVKTDDQSIPQQARSAYKHRDRLIRFVATGYELPQTDKVSMVLEGEWTTGKHGYQLQVEHCEEIVPQTEEGVYGYLSSRLIKGVGEKTAKLIVERFGADALRVLENTPEKLLEIRGITPAKLEDIKASYAESRCIRDLMILLSPFQVTPAAATKIYEHFGAKSADVLRSNPYELCQVSGFRFRRVDAIVRKGETPLDSPMRIHGAIYAALDVQREEKGHLFLDRKNLIRTAYQLLNERLPQVKVKPEAIIPVLEDMILKGEVVSSNGNIYQLPSFTREDDTARQIAKILSAPIQKVDVASALEQVRHTLNSPLSQRQSEAVYMPYRSNLTVVTGPPGTGKTTVLQFIIEVHKLLYPEGKIILAAPTGRASRRMAESTGWKDAKTLHSLLGLGNDETIINKGKQDSPLDADLIIIDETSMVDMGLARQFFSRIQPGTKIVLVGDVNQLQSVGAGDVFREMIDCGIIPVTTLTEIFRQKEGSLIAKNAALINEGNTNLEIQSNVEQDEFVLVRTKTQEEAADEVCRIFCELVQQHGVEHVQILSPFRTDGMASSGQLNQAIREIVNPVQGDSPDLKVGGNYFRLNDKVMQNKNNGKASNGDIGFIRKISRNEHGELKITIVFSDSRVVEYGLADMEHIELAYATTIHKAMGSEFEVVIVPVIRSHMRMWQKNLIYTAVTRAREKVVLVGERWVLFQAIHKEAEKRNTMLGERICKYHKAFRLREEMKNAS